MRYFGELVGIAFQIKDDLFDYGTGENIGKPTGIDIKEKKMTLPLIYALSKASYLQKRKIISIIKNNNNDPKKVNEVITFVLQNGGLEYATQQMLSYKEKALQLLAEMPESPSRNSLVELVRFTTERDN